MKFVEIFSHEASEFLWTEIPVAGTDKATGSLTSRGSYTQKALTKFQFLHLLSYV